MDSLSFRRVRAFLVTALLITACADEPDEEDVSVEASEQALADYGLVIPAELAVPAGNRLSSLLFADGVQIYDCQVSAEGVAAWVFRAPQADLYGLLGWPAGRHYAGPTWQAPDGSTVVGTRAAGVSVDASAIPWLLLQASAHSGEGRMSKVSYIQRLFTSGGIAPSSGCDVDHQRASVEVDYTALYALYESRRGFPIPSWPP
jgi:hypothetical protein